MSTKAAALPRAQAPVGSTQLLLPAVPELSAAERGGRPVREADSPGPARPHRPRRSHKARPSGCPGGNLTAAGTSQGSTMEMDVLSADICFE